MSQVTLLDAPFWYKAHVVKGPGSTAEPYPVAITKADPAGSAF